MSEMAHPLPFCHGVTLREETSAIRRSRVASTDGSAGIKTPALVPRFQVQSGVIGPMFEALFAMLIITVLILVPVAIVAKLTLDD